MASSAMAMSPLGMAASAVGDLFGGGEDSSNTSNAELVTAINNLNTILAGGVVATVTDEAIRTMGNKNNANNSMR